MRAPRHWLGGRAARLGLRVALALLASLCVLGLARVAGAVNVSAEHGLSSAVTEVGEPVTLTLSVSLDEDIDPQKPSLTVPPDFTASRVNTHTSKITIQRSVRLNFTARWVLVPGKLGKFELESPSVMVGDTRVTAKGKLTLEVVERGKGPPGGGNAGAQRGPGQGGLQSFFAPRDPFNLDDPFFQYKRPRKRLDTARDVSLPRELDDSAFLYLHADKTQAVVGEQVTLSTWLYFKVRVEGLEDQKEPPLAAFTRHVIVLPESVRRSPMETQVGGRRYGAIKLGEVAIFPVRAGELSTGSFSAKVEVVRGGRRVLLPRTSNDVVIQVTEPPKDKRPLGYNLGTVGRFKMKADVSPRQTQAGDTVSVSVEVTGVGSLPSELRLPARLGVEWLKPNIQDGEAMVHGNVGGWRIFEYAVRVHEAGELELGNLELPYWDPDKGAYEVATVELGAIAVRPRASGDAAPTPLATDDAAEDPFAGLAEARPTLEAFEPTLDGGLAPQTLWTWVLVPPLGVGLSSLALGVARRLRRRREAKKDDPAVLAARALEAMKKASDAKDAAAHAERALHLAVQAATGLRSRGMLRSELVEKLRVEVGEALTDDVVGLLDACSTVRFEPVSDERTAAEVHGRAEAVVKELSSLG